jgi:hypothetical protein
MECKIYFANGVQNLFCEWSAKFILRLIGVQNLFCEWSAKFILRRGSTKFILQFGMHVILQLNVGWAT